MKLINIVYGTNRVRVEEQVNTLVKDYVGEVDDFNRIVLDYNDTTIESIIEEAQTLPFLSNKKAIIIQNATLFTAIRSRNTVDHNIDLMIKYLENKEDDTLLIFSVQSENLDSRKKITKIAKTKSELFEVEEMQEAELRDYIRSVIERENVRFNPSLINMIIERTGIHYDTVKQELGKLLLYVDDEITTKHVEEVISKSLEQNVFLLTDYLLKNEKREAVMLFRDLMLQKEEPIKLLGLVAGQFRLLYQTKILKQEGLNSDAIAKRLRVHPYRVKLAYRTIDRYPLNYLLNKMILCRDMDYQFKTSYLEREALFEVFLTKI
ncbi:DNA polymerase III subunit delta [Phocicoccus pinnipedialis]|uniref:DNA polymerase III subunit delta n=1 Tax=Phocicoccus pinnipedialis TaxID=110845 RepID=A0A6V7RED1_9BACL|nr:DNA polymerase III subunit delta [Jeotgalicoccus pinnipedialis]MBP1939247.1 DNA polymerase-3 subunit delta [Jeotgalicoccus pinnipedialis]CAD2076151.1 DNA polymerase III subunit delta [Jeotgalicoccus pinnipedialis]